VPFVQPVETLMKIAMFCFAGRSVRYLSAEMTGFRRGIERVNDSEHVG